ncbi:SCP2 sterol-binding domain-containing protein [Allokutzneria sp. A3M-2-11 16]|uniref:SCP2 sterol-binding domain-containing protein n=1 Tax=Allokutzneria sp. A3M-2-11 16 TaxID=2962043 RepID=UPI0020B7EE82|nr:SCP2 sterol-binding domain-containing protein [Allokutzneria sp. A3M-2-11 16]MCP3799366.1 SCP2 sterol-binding domain-containing protein [Allokutzneria sp. A3M-2-11 16]
MPNTDPIAALAEVDPKKISNDEFVALLAAASDLADSGAEVDLSSLEPQKFARLVSRASKDQIDAVMVRPELRVKVLDEVFRRMGTHFRPDRAGSTTAVVHWRITRPEPDTYDRYEMVVDSGECTVNKDNAAEPRVSVTVSPPDFLKLVTGNGSAPVMFMTGKLKIKGDLGFAAGLMNLFDVPKA